MGLPGTSFYPQTLPPDTVVGRLSSGPGAAEAIPFDQLVAALVSTTNFLESISAAGILSPGLLYGGTLSNNASDATNDIDIALTKAVDSTNMILMSAAALTKRLDAVWAVGTNVGMRDTGSISNATWHIFIIRKDSDGSGDYLASLSPTAPTMPTGYTFFRRIGSILRASATIVAFSQNGDEFLRSASVLDVSANNPGTSAVTRTLSVPTGIKVTAIVNWSIVNASNAVAPFAYVSALDQTDEAPSGTLAPLSNAGAQVSTVAGTAARQGFQVATRTNTSAQVRSRLSLSDANVTVYGATLGWIDTRGRFG